MNATVRPTALAVLCGLTETSPLPAILSLECVTREYAAFLHKKRSSAVAGCVWVRGQRVYESVTYEQ